MRSIQFAVCLFSIVLFAGSRVWAADCRNCGSGACKQCTVKPNVYGYSPPTWRSWPQTDFDKPTEAKKVDRRLVRPEGFETPTPRREAEGTPAAPPEIDRQPDLPDEDPMKDTPPDLPPPLRNKQPLPVRQASASVQDRLKLAGAEPQQGRSSLDQLPPVEPPATNSNKLAAGSVAKPTVRKVAWINRMVGNPLRTTDDVKSTGRAHSTRRVSAANMPLVVGRSRLGNETANPLR